MTERRRGADTDGDVTRRVLTGLLGRLASPLRHPAEPAAPARSEAGIRTVADLVSARGLGPVRPADVESPVPDSGADETDGPAVADPPAADADASGTDPQPVADPEDAGSETVARVVDTEEEVDDPEPISADVPPSADGDEPLEPAADRPELTDSAADPVDPEGPAAAAVDPEAVEPEPVEPEVAVSEPTDVVAGKAKSGSGPARPRSTRRAWPWPADPEPAVAEPALPEPAVQEVPESAPDLPDNPTDPPVAELVAPPWARVPVGTEAAPRPRSAPEPDPAVATDRLKIVRSLSLRSPAPRPEPSPAPAPRRPSPEPRPVVARPPNRFSVPPRPTVVDDLAITGITRRSRGRWGSRIFTAFFVFVFAVIVLQLLDSLVYPFYR